MMTPYVRYRLNVIRETSMAMSSSARSAGKQWAPQLTGRLPMEVLRTIAKSTSVAACRSIQDSDALLSAGFTSLILTRPIVDPEALCKLGTMASTVKITATVDHFRHAELLSQNLCIGTTVDILIDVDLGQQVTGVRPGPDSALLATAAARLPGIRIRGVLVDDRAGDNEWGSAANGSIKRLSHDESLAVAQHCRRMIESDGNECRETVTGATSNASDLAFDVVTTCLSSPLTAHGQPAIELVCRVLSRPSLEWCVISVGTALLGDLRHSRIIEPAGARFLHGCEDIATLSLAGDALDLRIGAEVVVSSQHLRNQQHLPVVVLDN